MYGHMFGDRGDENVDLLLGLADSLVSEGKVTQAIDVYGRAYRIGSVSPERLGSLVEAMVEVARERASDFWNSSLPRQDIFLCSLCQSMYVDPVTIPCGHTFCKRCLAKDCYPKTCKKCGVSHAQTQLNPLKCNVLITTVLEKWKNNEMRAAKLRLEGCELFQRGEAIAALEKYREAFDLDPSNYHVVTNRAHTLLTLGQAEQALEDAEIAIRLHPLGPKGYFCKATALVTLERFEDAAEAFFICFVLDSSSSAVKEELTQLIHKLLIKNSSSHDYVDLGESSSNNHFFPSLQYQREHSGSEGSLYSSTSNDSYNWQSSDIDSDSSCDEEVLRNYRRVGRRIERDDVHRFLERVMNEVDKLHNTDAKFISNRVNPDLVDKKDFECSLCFRILWQPVTTPCGHSFCRMCLDRCLDHQPSCPLCKTSLERYLAERRQAITEFIDNAMQLYLPEDYAERKTIFEEEMEELSSAGKDPEHVIPLFLCTVAFPMMPCPLHAYEPRYRLMIRQSMESGTNQFGMCAFMEDSDNGIASHGTMLEIREVQYFPDGRAVVDTIGSKRFKVLHTGMRDGYHTGAVEFLFDVPPEDFEKDEISQLHDEVHRKAEMWFIRLPADIKRRVLEHFGQMPVIEDDYLNSQNGPSWFWWMLAILPLDRKAQIAVLAMTSLRRRLEVLHRVLLYLETHSPL